MNLKRGMLGLFAGLIGTGLGAPAHAEFRVVGYLPQGRSLQNIQYGKVTHILWSFASPGDDGSLNGIDAAKLRELVASAHANKVKVFLALGGGGNHDNGFQVCTASEAGRQALATSCMNAVHTYNLDGIDFDWEYPDGSQVTGFNAEVKLLAARLHAEGKQMSAAVTMNDWPKSFPTTVAYDGKEPGFDFLNIMVYDNPPPQSTVQAAQSGLDIWIKQKHLAKEKCILGCPFYGPGGRYADIVAKDPAAAWVDRDGAEGYNSIPTMRKKAAMAAAQAGGIMFWELGQDATGSLSLLSAVHEVLLTAVSVAGPSLRAEPSPTGWHWDGRGMFSYGAAAAGGRLEARIDASGRTRLVLIH